MGKVKLHKDRAATGPMTPDGWIDATAKRDYQKWLVEHPTTNRKEVMKTEKKIRKRLTTVNQQKEEENMSDKIVRKNGKWVLLPGATREDEMKLIELEIADRKAAVDARKEKEKESRGEPALRDVDDDEFDDDWVVEETTPKPPPAVKRESRALMVFHNALRRGQEIQRELEDVGSYRGYFHKYGRPVDTDKVQSVKQLIKLMEKEGAICVEYRKGFGLRMIVGTRRYSRSSKNASYWYARGIDINGIKTTKQLIRLMITCSASKMEVRDGFAKLLPDFWYNNITGKKERSGVWIDNKGQNRIAYTSITTIR